MESDGPRVVVAGLGKETPQASTLKQQDLFAPVLDNSCSCCHTVQALCSLGLWLIAVSSTHPERSSHTEEDFRRNLFQIAQPCQWQELVELEGHGILVCLVVGYLL